mmetsp:Transcript_7461/g.17042  ORF Transcript_7461/g.17042 Transcript_7461/m.17042 type:complete len:644 (-) Transcript_7461:62-1993(-)
MTDPVLLVDAWSEPRMEIHVDEEGRRPCLDASARHGTAFLCQQLREDMKVVLHEELEQLREWFKEHLPSHQAGCREPQQEQRFGNTEFLQRPRITLLSVEPADLGSSQELQSVTSEHGTHNANGVPAKCVDDSVVLPFSESEVSRLPGHTKESSDASPQKPVIRSMKSMLNEERSSRKKMERDMAKSASIMMRSGIEDDMASRASRLADFWAKLHHIHATPPRNMLSDLAARSAFTSFFSCLILINTVVIGIEANLNMVMALADEQRRTPQLPDIYIILGRSFTVLFAIEMFVKVFGWRLHFVFGPGARWNMFDMGLVVVSCLQEVMDDNNFSFMRVLRIFRMIKVLRVLRVLQVFHELRRMAAAIVNAMTSLSWAFFLLLLIMYIFAIFFMQGIVNWIPLESSEDDIPDLKEFYGNLGTTIYSLIMAISGGSDWGDIADPLSKVGVFYVMTFVLYIVFVIFGALNVLTAVFVETASEIVDRDLVATVEQRRSAAFVKDMESIFSELDRDGSGTLCWQEFLDTLKDVRVRAFLASHAIDVDNLPLMYKILKFQMGSSLSDENEIPIGEFILGCKHLTGAANSMHVINLAIDLDTLSETSLTNIHHMQQQLVELTALVRAVCPRDRNLDGTGGNRVDFKGYELG